MLFRSTTARVGCPFSGADGAVVGWTRQLLRAGCTGAAVIATTEVVGDAAARRLEGCWAMVLFVRKLTNEDHLSCDHERNRL